MDLFVCQRARHREQLADAEPAVQLISTLSPRWRDAQPLDTLCVRCVASGRIMISYMAGDKLRAQIHARGSRALYGNYHCQPAAATSAGSKSPLYVQHDLIFEGRLL